MRDQAVDRVPSVVLARSVDKAQFVDRALSADRARPVVLAHLPNITASVLRHLHGPETRNLEHHPADREHLSLTTTPEMD